MIDVWVGNYWKTKYSVRLTWNKVNLGHCWCIKETFVSLFLFRLYYSWCESKKSKTVLKCSCWITGNVLYLGFCWCEKKSSVNFVFLNLQWVPEHRNNVITKYSFRITGSKLNFGFCWCGNEMILSVLLFVY